MKETEVNWKEVELKAKAIQWDAPGGHTYSIMETYPGVEDVEYVLAYRAEDDGPEVARVLGGHVTEEDAMVAAVEHWRLDNED